MSGSGDSKAKWGVLHYISAQVSTGTVGAGQDESSELKLVTAVTSMRSAMLYSSTGNYRPIFQCSLCSAYLQCAEL